MGPDQASNGLFPWKRDDDDIPTVTRLNQKGGNDSVCQKKRYKFKHLDTL
jgi:hypothetical protein